MHAFHKWPANINSVALQAMATLGGPRVTHALSGDVCSAKEEEGRVRPQWGRWHWGCRPAAAHWDTTSRGLQQPWITKMYEMYDSRRMLERPFHSMITQFTCFSLLSWHSCQHFLLNTMQCWVRNAQSADFGKRAVNFFPRYDNFLENSWETCDVDQGQRRLCREAAEHVLSVRATVCMCVLV